MSFLEWSKSSVDYSRKLVDSAVEGARIGEDEFLKEEALAPYLEGSARQALRPTAIGACLGLLGGYLGNGRRSTSKALAYGFLGGIIHNAEALCSFFNPTVNSFKRINAPRTISGATWSPNSITYGGNNRTHMVRIPDAGRFELRLMDGAANPYLMQAGVLAAGLDGVDNQRDPGKRLDINMYTEGHTVKGVKKLPLNLLDALRTTDKSKVLRERMGDGFIDSYLKLKNDEWLSYTKHLTAWETANTLDC